MPSEQKAKPTPRAALQQAAQAEDLDTSVPPPQSPGTGIHPWTLTAAPATIQQLPCLPHSRQNNDPVWQTCGLQHLWSDESDSDVFNTQGQYLL